MFDPDALDVLRNGNLSDLDLSSDDEDTTAYNFAQTVRLGADVVNQNQRARLP